MSLNPYSTGIWSATALLHLWCKDRCRLNPYSTGIWSATLEILKLQNQYEDVLILILLEYGLRHGRSHRPTARGRTS